MTRPTSSLVGLCKRQPLLLQTTRRSDRKQVNVSRELADGLEALGRTNQTKLARLVELAGRQFLAMHAEERGELILESESAFWLRRQALELGLEDESALLAAFGEIIAELARGGAFNILTQLSSEAKVPLSQYIADVLIEHTEAKRV